MSISQAGVYSLKLYENKDFTFDYNDSELIILSSISNTGDIIELETNDNFIKYDNKLVPAENNTTLNDHTLAFEINGLVQSNLDIIEKLQFSIYGWIALITFMDTQVYLINIPFHPKVDKFDSQVTHTFFIEMKPRIFTFEKLEAVFDLPTIIPIINAGAYGASDWINPTSGLAEDWDDINPSKYTFSIVTGNGFTGNAQRLEIINTSFIFFIVSDFATVEIGESYKISVKYRTNSLDTPSTNSSFLQALDSVSSELIKVLLLENTGNCITIESNSFVATETTVRVSVSAHNGTAIIGDWAEVDEIKLIKQ